MRIGVLTSWRVPCGIYQYSARLVEAFSRIDGVEPVVLAGRADESRSVPEEWDGEVHDVARIGHWCNDGQYDLDIIGIVGHYDLNPGLKLDALHIQYQSMLFDQKAIADLSHCFRSPNTYHGPTAITFHDNCQASDFPYNAFDLHFSHRWNVGPPTVEVIPFGIEDRPPVIRSFGLGRNWHEVLRPICERNGWIFEDASSHEPIHGGGQRWVTHEELIQWLRGADAIVCWYKDVGQAGSSQAARTALATRRPVFTNNTKWFEDLPRTARDGQGMPYYEKCDDLEHLEYALRNHFQRSYVKENSWDAVASKLIEHYERVGTGTRGS